MEGSLKLSHERSNGSSGASIPVSNNGTYISLIKVENGHVNNPTISFINSETYNEISTIVNNHDAFIKGEMKRYVADHPNKAIGVFDKSAKYKVEEVEIPELEGHIPDNQFIGMIDKVTVNHKMVTSRFSSGKINVSNCNKTK